MHPNHYPVGSRQPAEWLTLAPFFKWGRLEVLPWSNALRVLQSRGSRGKFIGLDRSDGTIHDCVHWNVRRDRRRTFMSSPRIVLDKKSSTRTAKQVSEIMRRVPSRDTQPEMVLIRALRKAGFPFKTPANSLYQIKL